MNNFNFVLKDLFDKALSLYGQKTAIKFNDQELTYDQLNRLSNQLAHALIRHGIHVEDPVALMMSNCIEFPISDLAIMKAGAAKVPLNDMLSEREIMYILENAEPKAAIVGPNFFSMIDAIRNRVPSLKVIVGLSETVPDGVYRWNDFLEGMPETSPEADIQSTHRAGIFFSSGTTGLPKGLIHTQQSQVMNLFCCMIEFEIEERDQVLVMTPLPHAGGKFVQTGLLKGATIVITEKFDPSKALQLIKEGHITVTFMVPTMIYRLLDEVEKNNLDLSGHKLRTIAYAAAPILEERLMQGLKVFGPVFYQFYGQGECPNFIASLKKSDHSLHPDVVHRLRSCGKPTFMSVVKIVDEKGNEVPTGEAGEIVVRSPFIMERYHKMPEKTAETIVDGWLHTGDIGKMDEDGYLYLLDRKNDMIITGGMNVYSSEVENVIQQHPGVRQVAVIGIPHNDWGEQVLALVVPNDEHPPTEEEIIEFCKTRLAKYKQPKKVTFVSELPLTSYGKLDKKAMRKPYWEGQERSIH